MVCHRSKDHGLFDLTPDTHNCLCIALANLDSTAPLIAPLVPGPPRPTRHVSCDTSVVDASSKVSLSNIVGTVVMGPLLGISPEVTLAATMRHRRRTDEF